MDLNHFNFSDNGSVSSFGVADVIDEWWCSYVVIFWLLMMFLYQNIIRTFKYLFVLLVSMNSFNRINMW